MNDKQTKQKNAGGLATGIAIGAAIGAAAVALQDKKNQEKVKKTFHKVKKWADRTTEQISDKTDTMVKDAEKDLENVRKEIKEPERH